MVDITIKWSLILYSVVDEVSVGDEQSMYDMVDRVECVRSAQRGYGHYRVPSRCGQLWTSVVISELRAGYFE